MLKIRDSNGNFVEVPALRGKDGPPGKDAPQETVLHTAQTLDDAQKTQARSNIDAASTGELNQLKDDIDGIISDAWSADKTYAVGDYCIYNNALWRCLVSVSGSQHAPTNGSVEWVKCSVATEISTLNRVEFGKITITDLLEKSKYNTIYVTKKAGIATLEFSTGLNHTKQFNIYNNNLIGTIPDGFRPVRTIKVAPSFRNKIYAIFSVSPDGEIGIQPFETVTENASFDVAISYPTT